MQAQILKLLDQLDERQLLLILGSLVLLSLTAFAMYGIKPLYERLQQTNAEVAHLKSSGVAGPVGSLAPLEAEIDDYRRTLRGELQDIPVKRLEAHIIGALQNSAWRNQIELKSIEPLLMGDDDLPYQEVAFRVEVQGKYFDLDQWMNDVNTQLGFVVFKEYLLRVAKPEAEPILHARLLLATYRIEEGA